MNDLIPEYKPARDEKNLAMLVHLIPLTGFILPGLNLVVPLVLWLLKRDTSPFLGDHAREELNFQITLAVAVLIFIALKVLLVGFFLVPLIPIAVIVVMLLMVRAALCASRGDHYQYPFSLRLVS